MSVPPNPIDTFNFPPNNYGPGGNSSPLKHIPSNFQQLGFRYEISQHLNPAIIVQIALEYSNDNGVNWRHVGGFRRIGGVLPKNPDGTNATFCEGIFSFPMKSNLDIKGSFTITGGSLFTSGTFWCA